MDSLCLYDGKVYNKIYSFKYQGINFTICRDSNKYVFFKHDVINDRDIYTLYERWIQVFDNCLRIDDRTKIDNCINYLNSKSFSKNSDLIKTINSLLYCHRKKNITNVKRKIFNKYAILLLICTSSLIFGGVTLFNWYNEGKNVNHLMKNILNETKIEETVAFNATEIPQVSGDASQSQKYGEDYWTYMKTTLMSVDFNELKSINSDTKGWIYINNTNVNYPFVQGDDNSFYLNHSFDKTYNVAGWLFADYKSNFNKFLKNTVIYGHGRVDQVMFGSLEKVLNDSWYTNKENQIIKLSTPEKNTLWQIFSIYTIPSESYYLTHTFENDASYKKFLDTMLSRSIYNFGQKVDTDDNILTLSTCLDTNGNRIVIQAKLIKSQNRKN